MRLPGHCVDGFGGKRENEERKEREAYPVTLKTYYRVTSNFGADVVFASKVEADRYAQVLRMRSELQRAYVRPFVSAGDVEVSKLESVMSYLMDDYLGGEDGDA